jgi:hypothetical protein
MTVAIAVYASAFVALFWPVLLVLIIADAGSARR